MGVAVVILVMVVAIIVVVIVAVFVIVFKCLGVYLCVDVLAGKRSRLVFYESNLWTHGSILNTAQ